MNGTQFMAAFGALGLDAGASGSRRPPTSRARSRSRRCRGRGRASSRRSTRCGRCGARPTRPRTCSACSRTRRSTRRTAGATRCRTPTRSAARRRCTAPRATCSTTSTTRSPIELNAATDNPLVLVEDELLVSNGNFHGQPLAFALDALAMAVAELANISERRVERLVNPSLSGGLPAFLTGDGGLNSGFMIPQYVAASLVSENKVLAHPASVDSIPTSAGQEDHVSMGNAVGPEGAGRCSRTSERVLAIELLAGAQAVEFLAPLAAGRSACGRRASTSGRSRRGCATTGRSPATSRPSPRRSATARSSRRSRPRSGSCVTRRAETAR